ncbi:hypothetical protein SEA_TIMINATOR_46 [Arthrobacter phage Timinator]|uniref:Uncharacterized protein n=1 Tax=Arthrobacter phage Timinator TaxID=2024006 RepID=A0A222Z2P7_9CAUD|nr:hypothetical protein SEA_TIMINATOR_46 [Arthrobacter phage Timinator]
MSERVYVADVVAADPTTLDRTYGSTHTDKLNHIGAQLGIYRQCSIGYHGECSVAEQIGDDCPCKCKCHVDPFHMVVTVGSFELAESVYTVRIVQGEIDLGWLAPGWIEGRDERWITIEPGAIEPLERLLREAHSKLPIQAAGETSD